MLDAERAGTLEKPVHRTAIEVARLAAQAVGLRDTREQLQVDLVRQSPERAIADLVADLEPGSRFQMLRHHPEDLLAHVVAIHRAHVQPIEKGDGWSDALLLVIQRADATVDRRRGRRLAE